MFPRRSNIHILQTIENTNSIVTDIVLELLVTQIDYVSNRLYFW